MNAERARAFLLSLPCVVEWTQWGDVIYSVGDKALGGKMFAMVNVERASELVISFPAGPERFRELLEIEGMLAAPYFARIYWVSAARWDALRDREWQTELRAAHARTYGKMPARLRATLALPPAKLRAAVSARKKVLAKREKAKEEKKARADSLRE